MTVAPKKPRKTKVKPTPLQEFELIIEALQTYWDGQEYTEGGKMDKGDAAQLFNKHTTSVKKDIEGLSRDIFFDPDTLINELTDYPALSNAQLLCSLSTPDGFGDAYDLLIGSLNSTLPWAISLSASVGQYNDEDFDVYGNYSVMIGDADVIVNQAKNDAKIQITSAINHFNGQIKEAMAAMASIDPMNADEHQKDLFDQFRKTPIGERLFPIFEKETLSDSLPKATVTKNKKTL